MAQVQNNQVVFVKPSQTLISDIEQLKSERDGYTGPGADRSKLPAKVREQIEDLKASIAVHGVQTPAIGYVEKGKIKLISGRGRRGLLMELQEEDAKYNTYKLPVLIIPQGAPEKMLAVQSEVNTKTVAETPITTLQTYEKFKSLKLKNAEIGELVGKSEAWVTQVLKIAQVKILKEWLAAGKIDLASAALFVTQKYLTKDKKAWDEKAIAEGLKKAAEIAKSGGSNKIKQSAAKEASQPKAKPFLSKAVMKLIIDAPVGQVPEEIKLLLLLALKPELSLEEAVKKARGKLGWLKVVIANAAKAAEEKKAKAEKGKAKKAKPEPAEEDEEDFENDDLIEEDDVEEDEETEDEEFEDEDEE